MRLVCICPNPAVDHTVVVPGFTAGETIRALESFTTAGGKGLNVARFARGFGARVTSVTWLGEMGAELLRSLARRDGLNLHAAVAPAPAVRICPVLVHAEDGSVLATSDPTPRLDPATWAAFVELAADSAAGADAVCVSGSFPQVQDVEVTGALMRALAGAAPVWVDTSGVALAAVAGGFPAVGLKVNLAEARALLGERGGGTADRTARREEAVAAAEALVGGGRPVVVTAGGAGAAEATTAGSRWMDTPAVEVRNPTASGDAFLAGYLCAGTGLLNGIEDPLMAGVLAGAVNAGHTAPSVPAASLLALADRFAGSGGG
jgi:fructose-1-phosphate kinase PfkB-like protein